MSTAAATLEVAGSSFDNSRQTTTKTVAMTVSRCAGDEQGAYNDDYFHLFIYIINIIYLFIIILRCLNRMHVCDISSSMLFLSDSAICLNTFPRYILYSMFIHIVSIRAWLYYIVGIVRRRWPHHGCICVSGLKHYGLFWVPGKKNVNKSENALYIFARHHRWSVVRFFLRHYFFGRVPVL